tara:strand:+ start:1109 stop:2203 length:1095 start_codon:yes stop_codon:yes gene_type:complete
MKILGLMSGTSMDGLDCCYADINIDKTYNLQFEIIDFRTYDFTTDIKKLINQSLGNKDLDTTLKCNEDLGIFFNNISKKFLKNRHVELISLHGQTISHIDGENTVQIGNPKYLHEYFKIPICYEFRKLDIMLGGTGAPLIPFLDWLIFRNSSSDVITLNLGGIANITYLPSFCERNDIVGFDTGPGMCLIDEYVKLKFGLSYDKDGLLASKGNISHDLLYHLMKDHFINKRYPKSTSREVFGFEYLNKIINKFERIAAFDFLRTLVMFTARSIHCNIEKHIRYKDDLRLILSGGGSNNLLLVNDLKSLFKDVHITFINEYNIESDAKESFLMAVMGLTRFKNIDNNMPSVTGARQNACYGEIYE